MPAQPVRSFRVQRFLDDGFWLLDPAMAYFTHPHLVLIEQRMSTCSGWGSIRAGDSWFRRCFPPEKGMALDSNGWHEGVRVRSTERFDKRSEEVCLLMLLP